MAEALPGGTVTFLLTDIEGSTRLWEDEGEAMRVSVARHDDLVLEVVEEHGGHLVKPRGEGDAQFCVFARASDAATAALALQDAMVSEPWPTSRPLRIRIGVHTGEAELRDDDYYGPVVNRAARIKGVGHGGQTLLSGATADIVRDRLPAGAVLTDLGSHRLKDLASAERLFELRTEETALFPPLRSLDYLPTNLPLLRTSFVGREAELARVGELVTSSRLVTLTGPGGCGKTRLALHVGGEQLDRFPSGTWFVDLAPVRDPELVPAAVAVAIGAGGTEGGADLTEHLLDHLRPLSLLLVIDNCEHLVDAAATFVDQILDRCPSVRVVATSREPLGVDGEAVFRIPSLGASEAVALFDERAGATTGDAAARVCRQLDGIPLAIELAAARARSLGVRELADRIDDLFRMLRGGSRTAVARQQTLEAAIDWSHDLLAAEEQVLFRRLTVFSGGFTLAAVERVCAEGLVGDPIDLLGHLVDKSLVEHDDDRGRYGMLEALRQYGAARLQAAAEVEALRNAHLGWMVAMLSEATTDVARRGHDPWVAEFHDEVGNLRAATEWASATDDSESAAIIAGDTGFAWAYVGSRSPTKASWPG